MYNKLSGREWLEQRDGLSDVLPKDSPKGWAELDRMGWDELFPTIDSCRYPDGIWQGQYIPEHGELWSIEWEGAVDLTGDIPALNLSAEGRLLPYRFEKKIRLLSDHQLLIDYGVFNLSENPFYFLWALHPLLKIEPNMRLQLDSAVGGILVSYSAGERMGKRGDVRNWPRPAAGIDLTLTRDISDNTAEKFFVHPAPKEIFAEIRSPDTGDFLSLRSDPLSVPALGIWMNYGGWKGDYNMAIEPAMGDWDQLDQAIGQGKAIAAYPGRPVRWQILMSLGRYNGG